jgi:F-type H+-transporting ATPase subunit beta
MQGTITQIIGPVADVHFEGAVPAIKNALLYEDKGRKVVFEVAAHIGVNRVRAIALHDTAGMQRGVKVTDTGAPVSVPVGEASLGRLFNVVGDPIDGKGPVPKGTPLSSIHREAPKFTDQKTKAEVFETG